MGEKFNLFNKIEDCCGCGACANICPKSAITMKQDNLGFLYPIIDYNKCINCGLCKRVCTFNPNYDVAENFIEPDVYAVQHKDSEEIKKSQSGAAFVVFSDYILNNNGIVYGAGYAEHFRVVHKRAVDKKERDEFRGSKYVQSDLNNIFKTVKNDLENNKYVLFTGTPCQTMALKSYLNLLNIKTEKLFIIDLVCHGVPPGKIWNDNLEYLEQRNQGKITEVNFRDKKFGWQSHRESYVVNHKKIYSSQFTQLFYKHIMLRKACGNCYYTNIHRPSDITIGDFWGIGKINYELQKENKGVSLVLVNTEKGRFLFEQIKENLLCIESDIANCLQPNLQYPSKLSSKCNQFEKEYLNYGYRYIVKKYTDSWLKYNFKFIIDKIRKFLVDVKKKNKFLTLVWDIIKRRK